MLNRVVARADRFEVFGIFGVFFLMAIAASLLFGYVYNIIWMFKQMGIGPWSLGIFGVLFPPLGIIHGLWVWFV